MEPNDTRSNPRIFRQIMILQLQIISIWSENVPHFQRMLSGTLVIAIQNSLGNFASQTGGERNQSFAVFPQEIHINTGFDIKSLRVCFGNHITQIAISCFIPAQQYQMAGIRVKFMDAIKTSARCYIHFTTDNRFDSLRLAGAVKINCAIHNTMIGHSDCSLS